MQPLAYIILSNLPGENRLKNLKFFLGLGDNVVGADPRCQIVIPPQYEMLNHAVNIQIGLNFLTIEALQPHLVYVQANLNRFHRENNSDNYFPLSANVKYLPRIGQFFYIGRIKAAIGSASKEDLLQMRHIENKELFKFELKTKHKEEPSGRKITDGDLQFQGVDNIVEGPTLEDNVFDPEKMEIQLKVNNHPIEVEHKSDHQRRSQRSVTEQLDQQDAVEATLVLEDGMFGNEPTINLDFCPFQQAQNKQIDLKPAHEHSHKKSNESNPQPRPFSQQILMAEIRKNTQPEHQEEQIDFSMPDTIVDKEPEEGLHNSPSKKPQVVVQNMFKQVESKEQQNEEDGDQMPPTIQQVEEMDHLEKIKPTKTLQNKGHKPVFADRLYHSDQVSFQAREVADINIQNFDDLFGIQEKPQQIHKYQSVPAEIPQSVEPSLGLMHVSSANPEQEKKGAEKRKEENRKRGRSRQKKEEEEDNEDTIENKVNIIGFKPTSAHRDFLKKQGYQLVSNPHDDYGILLVKEPIKLHNKLLHALIDGKTIESEQWIFNKQSKIHSTINGLPWKQIYQKKGTHGNPLKGKGAFFVSQQLSDLFNGVIEKLGGNLITKLPDKRKIVNVILKVEDSKDTSLYLQNKQAKKWRFLRSQIIIDCVLRGNYSLEQKYRIDLQK